MCLLADPGKRIDALRAYAYFRWVDDNVDDRASTLSQRTAFIARQRKLAASLKLGTLPFAVVPEERMLVDLMGRSLGASLEMYIDNVMAVMEFDAQRRERLITQTELDRYMLDLATGVTEALYCFLGGGRTSPRDETRYAAATGAHVVHMLRDAYEDVAFGYFNIPSETLHSYGLDPADLSSPAVRDWVRRRVMLAKRLFRTGRASLSHIENLRLRLAGYAYIARFEILLRTIEREGYRLRPAYPDRKNFTASLRLLASVLRWALTPPARAADPRA